MKLLILIFLLFATMPALALQCDGLKWRRTTIDGHYVGYRGNVTGASVIQAELYRRGKIIGTDYDYPNLSGNFELYIYADFIVKKSDKPKFLCKS